MSEAEDKVHIHELETHRDRDTAVESRLAALEARLEELGSLAHSHAEPERIEEVAERVEELAEQLEEAIAEAPAEVIEDIPPEVAEEAREAETEAEDIAPASTHRLLRRVGNG